MLLESDTDDDDTEEVDSDGDCDRDRRSFGDGGDVDDGGAALPPAAESAAESVAESVALTSPEVGTGAGVLGAPR